MLKPTAVHDVRGMCLPRSASIGELPNRLLLSPPHDFTSPGESLSMPGSGLTTPLSFLNGALSGLNSGSGSPAWYEAGSGGIGGAYVVTGSTATLSTGSTATGAGYGSGSDGDTVAIALQLLLQGSSPCGSSACTVVTRGDTPVHREDLAETTNK
jgi:hypothetical protein